MKFMLAVASACSTAMASAAPPPATGPAALFGVREAIEHIDISPDGTRVAYVAPGPGRTSVLYTAALAGGDAKPAIGSAADPERLRWCNYVSDARLVCGYDAIEPISSPNGKVLVPFSRMIAIDPDGRNVKPLGNRDSFYATRLRQFDGAVLDWLPDQQDAVLMSRDYVPDADPTLASFRRKRDGLGVDRINVRTMAATRVEPPVKDATDYWTDGRGKVRLIESYRTTGETGKLTGKVVYRYRTAGSDEWKPFGSYDSDAGEGVRPLAVDATLNAAYALQKKDGRWALYRVKLDGSMATELVYAHPKVDVDNVVRIGRGGRVIGVTFAEDKRETVYFDPEYAKLRAALSRAVPQLPLVTFLGASRDERRLLLAASSDDHPGHYFVYDKKTRELAGIAPARPALEGAALAKVRPVRYPAPGGVEVPGYLTLPPGKETAKGLPAVLLPHGGPSARDEWGFDWLAQFLAREGYAVLQPNYRGSAGYGDAWLAENGFRSWRTSIGDVTAGAKWLVGQGIADPKRLAIVGWSYGGYAALQSGVAEPELYKAIVAVAPVTDLQLLKDDAEGYTSSRLVARFVGSGPHLAEGSPLRNVGRMRAPVLMFHGDRDLNVAVRHSERMAEALQRAGKKAEYVPYRGLEHSLIDSNARADMLSRIGAFLRANLGG